jgi:putative transposase
MKPGRSDVYFSTALLMEYVKVDPDFITITCLEWKHALTDARIKDIVIESLRFLCECFRLVIMDNHLHMIRQMRGDHKREDVQRATPLVMKT